MKNKFECEVVFKDHNLFLVGNTCWGIKINEAYLSGTEIDILPILSDDDYGQIIQLAIKEITSK